MNLGNRRLNPRDAELETAPFAATEMGLTVILQETESVQVHALKTTTRTRHLGFPRSLGA